MSALRIGIVGLGRHGARYANHLLKGDAPNARLVAVQRRSEAEGRAFAAEHGLRFHADLDGLLGDSGVDAVIVTTPTKHHAPVAVASAEAGKHILCEKPMARSVAECRRMVRAADAAGVKLFIGQTVRYAPLLAAMRERLPLVGELYSLNACMRQERTQIPWHLDGDASGGGVVIEIGVHLFDSLRYVAERNVVRVFGEMRDTYGAGVETYASGVLWFEDGANGVFDLSKTVNGRVTRFDAVGSEGNLIADLSVNTLERAVGRERTPLDAPPNVPTIPLLLQDFADAALNGSEPAVSGIDGLYTVAIAEAVYRSVRSGKPEAVEL